MDSTDSTRGRPEPNRFHEAYFTESASGPGDTLMVIIPDFSLDQPFGDPDGVVWSPIGGALPQADDRALVAESDDGSWWVLSWWSSAQAADDPVARPFVGQIAASAVAAAPTGWLVCDGSAVTATHPALRAALLADSSPYGTSGADPRLPDLRGAFPLGVSAGHALGTTGGEETHILTVAEMPVHAHSTPNSLNGGALWGAVWSGATQQENTIPTGSAGGGAAHNNLPPFTALKYVIYAGS